MAGRGKKTIISPEDMAKAEEYAYNGCQNNTIEGLMDWSQKFIEQCKDITKRLLKKRQQRKNDLRAAQLRTALVSKNAIMQIFLGKNELGQKDKVDTDINAVVKHQIIDFSNVKTISDSNAGSDGDST